MKMKSYVNILLLVFGTSLILAAASAAPMDADEEVSENAMFGHYELDGTLRDTLDPADVTALKKLLLHLNTADERLGFGRASRGWAQEPRGWSLRSLDGRMVRPWRADKRQVRFRQCYFNPISCFRK